MLIFRSLGERRHELESLIVSTKAIISKKLQDQINLVDSISQVLIATNIGITNSYLPQIHVITQEQNKNTSESSQSQSAPAIASTVTTSDVTDSTAGALTHRLPRIVQLCKRRVKCMSKQNSYCANFRCLC